MLLQFVQFVEGLPAGTRLVTLALGWILIVAVGTTLFFEIEGFFERRAARRRFAGRSRWWKTW